MLTWFLKTNKHLSDLFSFPLMHFILFPFNHRPFQSRSSCFGAPSKPRSQFTAVPVSFAIRYTSLPPFRFSHSSHPEKRDSTQIEESCEFTKVLRSSLSLPAALSMQLGREGRDEWESKRIEDSVLSPSPLPPSLWVIISFRSRCCPHCMFLSGQRG